MRTQHIVIPALAATLLSATVANAQGFRRFYRPHEEQKGFTVDTGEIGEKKIRNAYLGIPKTEISVPSFIFQRRKDRSAYFDRQYGILSGNSFPRDRVGRSVWRGMYIDIKSDYVFSMIQMPAAENLTSSSDEPVEGWSVEDVMAALDKQENTGPVIFGDLTEYPQQVERREERNERIEQLYNEATSEFREAMTHLDNDEAAWSNHLRNAGNKLENLLQLDSDDPRTLFALVLVSAEKGHSYTTTMYLARGLSKLTSLDQLELSREDFYPDRSVWRRRFDAATVTANQNDSPEAYLILALMAYLEGNYDIASASAKNAKDRYEAIDERMSDLSLQSSKIESYTENANSFYELIEAHRNRPPSESDQDQPAAEAN